MALSHLPSLLDLQGAHTQLVASGSSSLSPSFGFSGDGGSIFGGGDPTGGYPGSGTIEIGLPGGPGNSGGSGGSGSSGKVTPVSLFSQGNSWLSSILGIPAINWGRIAAFLLGLLMIAGGIYLIKPVQQVVVGTAKRAGKIAAATAA